MNNYLLPVLAIVLATLTLFIANRAVAVTHPYQFHADAKVVHANIGAVPSTYGYMYLYTDDTGKGNINVMFSNGSQLNWARFNARVKFVNSANVVIGVEHFDCWMGLAGIDGEKECKVSKPLVYSDFDAIKVDFYLSDISDPGTTAAVD